MVTNDARREQAVKRLESRQDFRKHLTVYVLVNSLLVVVWLATGAGFFWPIWPILGWGIAVVLHGWSLYGGKPITEDDIQREMQRHES